MEGSILQLSVMRDFVLRLYDVSSFHMFWRMRLVCALWARQSVHAQRHWLTWIKLYGPHRSVAPDRMEPVIRLTVPLYEQVLKNAMHLRKRQLCTQLHQQCATIRRLEWKASKLKAKLRLGRKFAKRAAELFQVLERMVDESARRDRVCQQLLEIEQGLLRYPRRREKKGRIQFNISND